MDCDIRHRKVLVSGASGLIGATLCRQLRQCGIEVMELAHRPRAGAYAWQAEAGAPPPPEAFAGVTAVIHLAGAPIAQRWSPRAQAAIRDSRINSTRALAGSMAALPPETRPDVFICMSGIAIYGTQREELRLAENAALAPPGESFLADVARDWEAATHAASAAGIRTVLLRTGMVITAHGGALPKLLLPFRLFLGGPVGDGNQRSAWISLDDLVSMIFFALRNRSLHGPLNAVAPHSVTNRDFVNVLGRIIHRPAFFRTPAWLLKVVFGRMAVETILANSAPFPAKALEAGFIFKHHEAVDALTAALAPGTPRAH